MTRVSFISIRFLATDIWIPLKMFPTTEESVYVPASAFKNKAIKGRKTFGLQGKQYLIRSFLGLELRKDTTVY